VAGLIQGADEAVYGTTAGGGSAGKGTVFRLDPDGASYTILHHFTDSTTDGAYPLSGLIQGAKGALYGTTQNGGVRSYGTVYKLNPDGTDYRLLHNFTGSGGDGAHPRAGLAQDTGGTLWGTTAGGGSADRSTVFSLKADGTGCAILHSFTSIGNEGSVPAAGLIQGRDGAFYGTTKQGGDMNFGTVFRLTPNRAPVLNCPAATAFPCSPPGGFLITLPVQASDPDGLDLTVSWSVDGSTQAVVAGDPLATATVTFTNVFSPGTHMITFTVSDGYTNVSCQTTLTIAADTEPPTFTCPANQTVEFANETGAQLTFASPTATDDCSTQVSVNCIPPSGTLFPIGTTTVTCAAADGAGNQVQCRFTVTALGARSVVRDMAKDLARLWAMAKHPQDWQRLAEAREHLLKALSPGSWVDKTHVAGPHGERVFQHLKGAAQPLEELRKHRRGEINDVAVQALLARLVKVARLLAAVEIADAASAGGSPKSIAQARQELAQGDAEVTQRKFASAIEHYCHAWKQAMHLRVRTQHGAHAADSCETPGS